MFVISSLSPVDTFCRGSAGGAEEDLQEKEEEVDYQWLDSVVTGIVSRSTGSTSLCLRLWSPRLRPTDPPVCSTGFCPSAAERVNAREPPMGPLRATRRPPVLFSEAKPSSVWRGFCRGFSVKSWV